MNQGTPQGQDTPQRTAGPSPFASIVLFFVFLAICFGLGYPAMCRYVPWEAGNRDARVYYHMIVGAPPGDPVHAPAVYRVLVPTMARGVLHGLAPFEFGSWDRAWLALLVVNSVFVALSASIVMRLAAMISRDPTATALAPWVYLASFVVVNYHLAGMIDAAEGFFLLALLFALMHDRWWALPFLIAIGVLAKETVLPFGLTAVVVWWAIEHQASRDGASLRRWLPIGVAVAAGILTLAVCRYWIDVAAYEAHTFSWSRVVGTVANLHACVFEKTQLYTFALLVPLGIPRLRRIPGRLLGASVGMAAVAAVLGAYAEIQGNLHRPWFNTFGPILAVSSAILLRDLIVGRGRPATKHNEGS